MVFPFIVASEMITTQFASFVSKAFNDSRSLALSISNPSRRLCSAVISRSHCRALLSYISTLGVAGRMGGM
jgi:hypothetical protein